MNEKYELVTNDSIAIDQNKLYRIRALKDFSDIKKGDIGGYVQSEENLSDVGCCWIYDDAISYGNAKVLDNAKEYNHAVIKDNVILKDNASMHGRSRACGQVYICNNAYLRGHCYLSGSVEISMNALIIGNTVISDAVRLTDKCRIYGDWILSGNTIIYGNANLEGGGSITDSCIYDDAMITSHHASIYKTEIRANAIIDVENFESPLKSIFGKDAYITSNSDFISLKIYNEILTIYKTKHGILFNNRVETLPEKEFRKYIAAEYPDDKKKFNSVIKMANIILGK